MIDFRVIMFWWSIVLCFLVVRGDENGWREVKTSQGPVRGRIDPLGLYAFYNIPYATAPKGRDRFKAPYPAPVWFEPLDAVNKNITCIQSEIGFKDSESISIQEDCLVANVYVPDTDKKNLPVLVYIHGGAFEMGHGNLFTPKNLAKDKEIIVVTFNYRLGVQGFLCLGTEEVPGNAGLKDQVALLRWVNENIGNFGGNANDVTIAGYSAGSVSADLLMLSKASDGLFNKVILESGVSVGSIAIQRDPIENARNYAKLYDFKSDDVFALQEFYLSTPLETLTKSTFFKRKDASILFGPCVERKTSGKAILEDDPVNIIKKRNYKKVPMVIGVTNMEGLLQVMNFAAWKDEMNDKFSNFLPIDLSFENDEEKQEVAQLIKEFYFKDQDIEEESLLAFISYYSNILFDYPTLKSVKLHAEAGHDSIYLYEYSFVEKQEPYIPHTKVKGANHCAQTRAVLDGTAFHANEADASEEMKEMKSIIRELWANFVYHGKPVPEESSLPAWPPANVVRAPYMSLNLPLQLKGALNPDRGFFWDQIYERHYRGPSAPPKPNVKRSEL